MNTFGIVNTPLFGRFLCWCSSIFSVPVNTNLFARKYARYRYHLQSIAYASTQQSQLRHGDSPAGPRRELHPWSWREGRAGGREWSGKVYAPAHRDGGDLP